MHVWRICKQRHLPSAWSGIGAQTVGGRWNRKGERMVYTSTNLSLAALELFVHLEPSLMPVDLHAVSATIPDTVLIEKLALDDLPNNWRAYPAPTRLQECGSRWLREMRSLALEVPSAVNPEENNVLFNPFHPDASKITVLPSRPFQFDPRMWKHLPNT